MRRDDVASSSVRRHFDVMYPPENHVLVFSCYNYDVKSGLKHAVFGRASSHRKAKRKSQKLFSFLKGFVVWRQTGSRKTYLFREILLSRVTKVVSLYKRI